MKKMLVLAMLCVASVCSASEQLIDLSVSKHHCALKGDYRPMHWNKYRLHCPCVVDRVKAEFPRSNRLFIMDEVFGQQEAEAKRLGSKWVAKDFRPNRWWEK